MAFSFSTAGATPQANPLSRGSLQLGGSTPQAKALNSAQAPVNWSSMSLPPTASAPLKSQTIQHPDGTKITHNYDTANGNAQGATQPAAYNPQQNQNLVTPKAEQPTFNGIIGGLTHSATGADSPAPQLTQQLGTTAQQGSPEAQGYTAQTAQYGAGNIPIGQKAEDIANNYSGQIADVAKNAAQGQVGMLTSGALNPVALGRAGVISQNASSEQQALASAEQAALQGTSQALTGQNQAANASNEAAGQAYTGQNLKQSGTQQAATLGQEQQGLNQSGLTSAGTLTQPSGSFPFSYNPLTGQFSSGAGGSSQGAPTLTYNPQQDANTLAQAVIANKVPFSDAEAALGYAGNVGKGLLTSAITSQGGDLTKIQAQQAATQSNVQTAGTASTQANQKIYTDALSNVGNLTNQLGNVDDLGSLLISTAQEGGINPSNAKFANQTLQQIQSQLSGDQQAQFTSTLATLRNKVTALLNVGGGDIPSDITSKANQVLDGTLQINSLASVINRIAKEGLIVVGNQAKVASSAYQNIQDAAGNSQTQTSQTPSQSFKEGQTSQDGALVFQGGKWMVKK